MQKNSVRTWLNQRHVCNEISRWRGSARQLPVEFTPPPPECSISSSRVTPSWILRPFDAQVYRFEGHQSTIRLRVERELLTGEFPPEKSKKTIAAHRPHDLHFVCEGFIHKKLTWIHFFPLQYFPIQSRLYREQRAGVTSPSFINRQHVKIL